MKLYRLTRYDDDSDPDYVGTFAECAPIMRSWCLPETARAELIDFPVDKAGLLTFLNKGTGLIKVEKTWALTPRGGLKEVPNGE